MQLKAKRALVTGSSRWIGRGIALKLAEEGAVVAVHYLHNEDAAKSTLDLIRDRGGNGTILQGDVTDPEQVVDVARRAADALGGIDIFVSNAATRTPRILSTTLRGHGSTMGHRDGLPS